MLGNYLVRGLMIGLIFGVPAGAIGALTIQRTLKSGFSAGLATGLGSSAADLLYACVGIFGMTLVSGFLTRHQRPIRLLGGLLIAALGVHIFRQKPQNQQQESSRLKLPLCFASSFAIAVTNPATVLSFLMAFTAFEITGEQTAAQSVQLITGIYFCNREDIGNYISFRYGIVLHELHKAGGGITAAKSYHQAEHGSKPEKQSFH